MRVIKTVNAPAAVGPYVQAIAAGDFLFVSGQIPFDPRTMKVAGEGIAEQTRQSLENVKAIINEAGYTLNDVVRCGVFLKDMNHFTAMNEIYGQYFANHKPARACVEVARLPKDVLVEIEATVYMNVKKSCECK